VVFVCRTQNKEMFCFAKQLNQQKVLKRFFCFVLEEEMPLFACVISQK